MDEPKYKIGDFIQVDHLGRSVWRVKKRRISFKDPKRYLYLCRCVSCLLDKHYGNVRWFREDYLENYGCLLDKAFGGKYD